MSRSVNKSILLGNVGKDPDIRTTQGGAIIANFSIATEDRRKDAQGNWQPETEWHNCLAFKRTAEIVRDYVKKGSLLYVEGKNVTESWPDKQTGAKRYAHKIVVFELILLSGKDEQNKASNTTTTAPDESETITDLDAPF
jgi:single-strand DNA-binding protein